jgi:hypothetical protein
VVGRIQPHDRAFCGRGASFIINTIRSNEGKYCEDGVQAALAEAVCIMANHDNYKSSKCHTKAQKAAAEMTRTPLSTQGAIGLLASKLKTSRRGGASLCSFVESFLSKDFSKDDCASLAQQNEL